MSAEKTIPEYLAYVAAKDEANGFSGWRTTREVAEYYHISTPEARKLLNRLWERDHIDSARDGATLIWRALA